MTVPPLRKVTAFPAAVDVDATDLVPIVHDPTGAAASEKASIAQLLQSIEGLTAGTPAAGDSALFVASGVAKKADLAAAYAAANRPIWVPATQFRALSGAPVEWAAVNFPPAWLLPNSSSPIVMASLLVPADWASFKVTPWLANHGGDAGDVRTQLFVFGGVEVGSVPGSGDRTLDAGGTTSAVPATEGEIIAPFSLTRVRTVAGLSVQRIYMRRDAGNAADTLTHSLRFFGAMIEKVT